MKTRHVVVMLLALASFLTYLGEEGKRRASAPLPEVVPSIDTDDVFTSGCTCTFGNFIYKNTFTDTTIANHGIKP